MNVRPCVQEYPDKDDKATRVVKPVKAATQRAVSGSTRTSTHGIAGPPFLQDDHGEEQRGRDGSLDKQSEQIAADLASWDDDEQPRERVAHADEHELPLREGQHLGGYVRGGLCPTSNGTTATTSTTSRSEQGGWRSQQRCSHLQLVHHHAQEDNNEQQHNKLVQEHLVQAQRIGRFLQRHLLECSYERENGKEHQHQHLALHSHRARFLIFRARTVVIMQ